ncbi:hypothetical protein ABZ924_31535 [Streptomyces sp. NPDC046876]|uniref:hypothetical protein n=1 Tax=Streptomyces sp. NPDC046876 TaxID=3155616 RepID=UPI0033DBD297
MAAGLAAFVNHVGAMPAAARCWPPRRTRRTAELAENPLMFLDEAMRKRLAVARAVSPVERRSLAPPLEHHRRAVIIATEMNAFRKSAERVQLWA